MHLPVQKLLEALSAPNYMGEMSLILIDIYALMLVNVITVITTAHSVQHLCGYRLFLKLRDQDAQIVVDIIGIEESYGRELSLAENNYDY